MSIPTLVLQKGKEASALHRHPWVFSGALERRPTDVAHGAIVKVAAADGRILGTGTYSAASSIAVRLFAFGDGVDALDADWFERAFRAAADRRLMTGVGPSEGTTGYRLVFGEADGVPGLVVDRYADVCVVQSSTAGVDACMPAIIEALDRVVAPKAIVERSDLAVRKDEGLPERVGMLRGEPVHEVEFTERGARFIARPLDGQKTGFFLDQRDLRSRIAAYAAGRTALNMFSYTGATAVAMARAGATRVRNVDASASALAMIPKHASVNGLEEGALETVESDAFQWLSSSGDAKFGLVAIDPPALIKSAKDADEGRKAYHFLNRAALRLVEDGGIFITSSCSRHLSEEDLAFILRRASVQAGAVLEVLEIVRQSPDHPLSVYVPESAYLKSFICKVRRSA